VYSMIWVVHDALEKCIIHRFYLSGCQLLSILVSYLYSRPMQ